MNTRNNNKIVKPADGLASAFSPVSSNVAVIAERKQLVHELSALFDAKFKVLEERVMSQFSALRTEVAGVRADLLLLSGRINALESRCDVYADDIAQLRTTVNLLENDAVSTDVVVLNVPNNADAACVVDNMCKALPCGALPVCNVFRTGLHNNSTKCVPIIAKLHSAMDRTKLFRALAEFRKTNKRSLCLRDIGCDGDTSVPVHECLSSYNKSILRSALNYKKSKQLSAVFTLRGYVHVRVLPNDRATKICDLNALKKIVDDKLN